MTKETQPALGEAKTTALPRPSLVETAYIGAEVPCRQCGLVVHCEMPHHKGHDEDVVFFCPGCRVTMLDMPTLPEGYRFLRELGRGGMGAVYLAAFEGGERAIKTILPKGALSAELRRLFLQEASIQSRLRHPAIVEVFDFLEVSPGIFCMVMEYVPGKNAGELLDQGPLTPAAAIGIVEKALAGLEYVHSQGVLHCDFKDPNILVGPSSGESLSVKLSDFGLARPYAAHGASSITREGTISGTLAYMPPEQITDPFQVQPTADIYSVGATLYRLLSGAFPHEVPSGRSPVLAVLKDPIVPIRQRLPEVQEALEALIEKALSFEPSARFASAGEMRRALLEVLPAG